MTISEKLISLMPKKETKLKGHKDKCTCSHCKWVATRNSLLSQILEVLERVEVDKSIINDLIKSNIKIKRETKTHYGGRKLGKCNKFTNTYSSIEDRGLDSAISQGDIIKLKEPKDE